MYNQWKIISLLSILVLGSAWLTHYFESPAENILIPVIANYPDDYMYHFVTLTMEKDGSLKNELSAKYMAHYPDETAQLLEPRLKIFHENTPPTDISARKGYVASNGDSLQLLGETKLQRKNIEGEQETEITTRDVHVLIGKEYAETDQPATILRDNTISQSKGMQMFLQEDRIKLSSNVQTVIMP